MERLGARKSRSKRQGDWVRLSMCANLIRFELLKSEFRLLQILSKEIQMTVQIEFAQWVIDSILEDGDDDAAAQVVIMELGSSVSSEL